MRIWLLVFALYAYKSRSHTYRLVTFDLQSEHTMVRHIIIVKTHFKKVNHKTKFKFRQRQTSRRNMLQMS
jgi:hypothetical protein